MPEIDWPEFPELEEYEKIEDRRIVTDESYFRKLLTFRTLYFDALDKYNDKLNLIGEKKDGTNFTTKR